LLLSKPMSISLQQPLFQVFPVDDPEDEDHVVGVVELIHESIVTDACLLHVICGDLVWGTRKPMDLLCGGRRRWFNPSGHMRPRVP
jgi:hypothetical protein